MAGVPRRRIILMLAIVASVAACSEGTSESPADTGAETTTSAPVTTSESTTTTMATTTTSAVVAICDVLSFAPYETRKEALAELGDPEDVTSACPEALATTEAAVEVDTAARSLEDRDITDLESELSCSGDQFEWSVTNSFDVAIGVYGIAELYRVVENEAVDRLASPDTPVVWRLEPGETAILDGTFPPQDQQLDRCSVAGWFFLADGEDLPGDVAVAGASAGVGDDPSVWLPILYQRQRMHEVTGQREFVETFEDLRSMAYARLVDDAFPVTTDEPDDTGAPAVEVCRAVSVGDGSTGVVYQVGPAGAPASESDLVFAVFRQGADGVWRWLGSALRWSAPNMATCEDWVEAASA